MSHERVHTADKPYTCDTCHKGFTPKSNLDIHQHVQAGDKPFECKISHTRFYPSSGLMYHEATHNIY